MSTRAVIIRIRPDWRMEAGQSFSNGFRNTSILNAHYNTQEKVDELFSKMYKNGISCLGNSIEETKWYRDWDTYNYECAGHPSSFFTNDNITKWLRKLDWPNFASVWDGKSWHDFEITLHLPEWYSYRGDDEDLGKRLEEDTSGLNEELAELLRNLYFGKK